MRDFDHDYRLFFDLSPDLLCIAGFDGYFKRINASVSKLLEYSEAELYACPINDFVFEDDKQLTIEARENLTESQTTLLNFENRYVKKSGEIVWLAWTSHPVPSDHLVFAIAKDITHKKRLETERMAVLEALTKVNGDLKQFTLSTSHDLRSPLSTLLMVFDLLDVSKIRDSETLELLEILKLTGTNLEKTLDKYVDALSEAIGGENRVENVNLNDSLSYVLESTDSIINESNATVHTDFSEVDAVTFNKTFMDSVFLNLITNSIRYARPDVPPVISIRAEKAKGVRRLIVSDNGSGFDMKKAEGKIFGLNQTFHNHRDSKGVGLYLVHSQVTSLGGRISVESEVDKGTRFTISFQE